MGEIEKARDLFSSITGDSFLAGVAKHKSYDEEKAREHAIFCNVRYDMT
jgi:hypothetical protein